MLDQVESILVAAFVGFVGGTVRVCRWFDIEFRQVVRSMNRFLMIPAVILALTGQSWGTESVFGMLSECQVGPATRYPAPVRAVVPGFVRCRCIVLDHDRRILGRLSEPLGLQSLQALQR